MGGKAARVTDGIQSKTLHYCIYGTYCMFQILMNIEMSVGNHSFKISLQAKIMIENIKFLHGSPFLLAFILKNQHSDDIQYSINQII